VQNLPAPEVRLAEVDATKDDEEVVDDAVIAEGSPGSVWVSRITGMVGALFLLLALAAWFLRHGHLRLVLALLIVALFASIIHSYTFENGG